MKFLDEFLPNKRYVFDKDTYLEYMGDIYDEVYSPEEYEKVWLDKCDNLEVTVTSERMGHIQIGNSEYGIHVKWCREIPTIRLLTGEDIQED